MSLTRSFLKSLGLNDDQSNAIIEQYTPVTDELKKLRDDKKDLSDKLTAANTELDGLKNGEDFKAKYDTEHKAFEDYKAQVVAEKERERVKAAYRKLLVDEKINEKHIDSILGITNFDGMKLAQDGTLDGVDALKQTIADKYADFRIVQGKDVHQPNTPPRVDNGGSNGDIRAMTAKWHESRYGKAPEKG